LVQYHGGDIIRGTTAERTGGTWTTLPVGYLFIETNTMDGYYWNGTTWTKIIGASGSVFTSSTAGIVPASGGGTVNFLRADGNWALPPAGGGGGSNTASNVGSAGTGVFDGLVVSDLQFRKLNALSGKITIALDAANKKVDFDVPDGSTTAKGVVELATSGEAVANVVVQGNDARLSDSRAPTGSAGGDLAGSTYPNPTVANNAITYAKMADMVANSVTGNATAATADPTDIVIGTNTVLGRVAGNIVAAQLATGQIANNAVDNTKINDMVANTIKGNATAATADPTDIAVGTNSVLGRVAGNIVAAQIVDAQITASTITYAKIQNVSVTSTFLGRITTGAGVIEELTGTQATTLLDVFTSALKGLVPLSGGGTVNYLRADGTWAAPPGTFSLANNAVTNAILNDMAANTIKGNATAATADPTDIAIGTNTVLGRVAGNIVAAQLATAQIADDAVTYVKIQKVSATSRILGRITAAAGDIEELTGTQATTLLDLFTSTLKGLVPLSGGGTANFLRADATWQVPPISGSASGDLTGSYPGPTVAANTIDNTKVADMAANTVKANATAATADPADLAIGANTVLGRVAGNIVAASLVDAQITASTITYAKIQNVSATSRFLGRITAAAGVIEELTPT